MAKGDENQEILELLADFPNGVFIGHLLGKDPTAAERKAMARRLKALVQDAKLVVTGKGRGTRYKLAETVGAEEEELDDDSIISLSKAGKSILDAVRQPIQKRTPVAYNRSFLEQYEPNKTHYLPLKVRRHLAEIGQTDLPNEPAGTYAQHVLQRLLIDLSFNSSRLEGNTYSLLDTKRLIKMGETLEGAADKDTQMILNHKDAINFLVEGAEYVGFNPMTIRNLHGLLSNNLLSDPEAVGKLRAISVAISGTVFKPLDVPALIQEVFDQILHTATLISDPFEQSFFALVHLPYLQPFEDVNKRVSRLAANIPMIKHNLRPLSFIDVPDDQYVSGVLGVYELNQVDLLRDVYIWAYERSAKEYTAIRNTLGEPDAFRLKYREAMKTVVQKIIVDGLARAGALKFLSEWAERSIIDVDQMEFVRVVSTELDALHEGNFVRYGVTPNTFSAWQSVWKASNKPDS